MTQTQVGACSSRKTFTVFEAAYMHIYVVKRGWRNEEGLVKFGLDYILC